MSILKEIHQVLQLNESGERGTSSFDLSEAVVTELIEIKHIRSVRFITTWEDDSELCYSVKFKCKGLKGLQHIGFWWMGHKKDFGTFNQIQHWEEANTSAKSNDICTDIIKQAAKFRLTDFK